MKVHVVINHIGIDGSYAVGAYSKKEDADKLCDLYAQSDDSGEYDYYAVSTLEIDSHPVEKYRLSTTKHTELLYDD